MAGIAVRKLLRDYIGMGPDLTSLEIKGVLRERDVLLKKVYFKLFYAIFQSYKLIRWMCLAWLYQLLTNRVNQLHYK